MDNSTRFFDQVSSQKDFVIDDVSITPLPKNCSQLFLNGDAEYGKTPSFLLYMASPTDVDTVDPDSRMKISLSW